nr:hypothetical protein Ade03nite_79810 [Actinoplanes derwentensis]
MTDQTVFQAQKITPNATAMTEATTMSIVRHRFGLVVMKRLPAGTGRRRTPWPPGDGARDTTRLEKTELPALALPRSGARVCGFTRTLSAVRSPVGLHLLR